MANVINNQPMTRIQLKMTSDATDWMTGTGVIESGLHVSRTLASDTDLHVPIRLMNLFNRPVTVEKGTFLAELQPASVVSSVQELPPTEPEFKKQLLEDVDPSVVRAERHQLSRLIDEFQDLFSRSEYDLGQTGIVKHTIDTADHRSIKQALRRHPPLHQQTIKEQTAEMMKQDLVEPASSEWAANVVLVKKKTCKLCFCIDYRKLNEATKKDVYPLPRIDECLDAMCGARWFSTFDLRAARSGQLGPNDLRQP